MSEQLLEYFQQNGFTLRIMQTMGDQNSCGFHSVLQAYYLPYKNASREVKSFYAQTLRRKIGAALKKNKAEDYLLREFNDWVPIEDSVFESIGDFVEKNIIVLTQEHGGIVSQEMINVDTHQVKKKENRNFIFVLHEGFHYSTVELAADGERWSHFSSDDPLVKFVLEKAPQFFRGVNNQNFQQLPNQPVEQFKKKQADGRGQLEKFVAYKQLEKNPKDVDKKLKSDSYKKFLEVSAKIEDQIFALIVQSRDFAEQLNVSGSDTDELVRSLLESSAFPLSTDAGFSHSAINFGGPLMQYYNSDPAARFYLILETKNFDQLYHYSSEIVYRFYWGLQEKKRANVLDFFNKLPEDFFAVLLVWTGDWITTFFNKHCMLTYEYDPVSGAAIPKTEKFQVSTPVVIENSQKNNFIPSDYFTDASGKFNLKVTGKPNYEKIKADFLDNNGKFNASGIPLGWQA